MPAPFPVGIPRLALIGVTGYASVYLNHVREALRSGSVHLVAAVIINPERVPSVIAELSAGGTTIYGSADELFAGEAGSVDLCLIPTGIHWHTRMTIAALRCGMHVLVEKPLAGSVADAAAIRHAEAETGRWVAVGFQDLYASAARTVKSRILAGEIGRLREVRMIGLWPRSTAYFTRNPWAGRRFAEGAAVSDSPLNNAFAHFVNLSLLFAGASEQESAAVTVESSELFRAHDIEMFDTAVVRGVSPEGVRFWFGVSHATQVHRDPEIHLTGDAGTIVWRHNDRCELTRFDGVSQPIPLPDESVCRRAMFTAVLERLHTPETPVCTTAIALRHSQFIEAVQNTSAIHPFPPSLVNPIPAPSGGGQIHSVIGLETALTRAFESSAPLADISNFKPATLLGV